MRRGVRVAPHPGTSSVATSKTTTKRNALMGENAAAGVTGKEIWLDGEWVAWDDANIHVLTHTLHYGLGVFEGIRCYAGADGLSLIHI